jgi:recombination protein RecA
MATAQEDKLKALQLTIEKVEKQYGKGSIMKLGDSRVVDIETISTGSLGLDLALRHRWTSQR